jgi:ectoine hydroxylase-related dioxygenase (phytanoyl-CoA dioxygenase family)
LKTAAVDEIQVRGYAIVTGVLSPTSINAILAALCGFERSRSKRRGETFGIRDLLHIDEIQALARSDALTSVTGPIAGADARAVRGIFFDKTAGANWPVAWHQDLSLAVSARQDIDGWTAWSLKNGIHHVQPPADILERMLTVRLHLDDCGPENGPLRVLPGTHRTGRLKRDGIDAARITIKGASCCVKKGDAVLMRPLLIHSSSAAANPSHRRVLHLEYAPPGLLPDGLSWAFQ